jgi:hypothetical protein
MLKGRRWCPTRGDHGQVGGARHGYDAHHLGESTGGAHIGLQVVDGPAVDEVAEGEAGVLALAAGDGNGGGAAELAVAVDVLRRHGFLEPGKVILLKRACQTYGLRSIVGVVGIHHQRYVVADRPADRFASRS